jgi:hypothetical protein
MIAGAMRLRAFVALVVLACCACSSTPKTWGAPRDLADPWRPSDCQTLAASFSVVRMAKDMRAPKDGVMEYTQQLLEPQKHADQILGEFSEAWDRDLQPLQLFQECMERWQSWRTRKQS